MPDVGDTVIHGALGVSNEMPFMHMVTSSLVMGIADGPTEVHKVTLARQLLKTFEPDEGLFPDYHIPRLQAAAKAKYADELAAMKADYEAMGGRRGGGRST